MADAGGDAVPWKPGRRDVVATMVMSALSGVSFGLTIGIISFYLVYDTISRDCPGFSGQVGCETAPHAGCVWTDALGAQPVSTLNGSAPVSSCKYGDYESVYCPQYTTQDACKTHNASVYNFGAQKCEHAVGLLPWQAGLFATGQPFGAVLASFGANVAMDRARFRPLLLASAFLFSLSGALMHIGRATDVFGVLVLGRVLSGVAVAALRQLASVLPFEVFGPGPTAGTVTSFLQPFTELGVLIGGVYTFFGVPKTAEAETRVEALIHGHIAMMHALAAAVAVTCAFVREPPLPAGQRGCVPLPPGGLILPLLKFPGRLALLVLMALAFVGTGLLGIGIFAPLYAEEAWGLEPSLAPLVMQSFSAGSGLLSFGLRRCLTRPRPVFLAGLVGASLSSFGFGLVVSPDVGASTGARHALAMVFAATFFLALQGFLGSALFELALTLLPPHVRAGGGAFMNTAFNCVATGLTFAYPVAVVALSGGRSGNILEGLSIIYFIFTGIGAVSVAVLGKWMVPAAQGSGDSDPDRDPEEMSPQSEKLSSPPGGAAAPCDGAAAPPDPAPANPSAT